MEQQDVQQLFFQHIKNNLPSHLSLVDEIAELLNISNDSAYRRIRGEKGLSFDEIRTLCTHFKISLDQWLYIKSDSIIFNGLLADSTNFGFELYLNDILRQLQFMNSFEKSEVMYLAKDVPIFHLFNYHELAAFKCFFWMKTILQYPFFGKSVFVMDDFIQPLEQTGKKILEEYNKCSSHEIWNVETVHVAIRQIEYYKDTRMFASAQDILDLYTALEKTLDHIEKQAELGFKFPLGTSSLQKKGVYKLYVNEFILGDNTVFAVLNDTKVAYINHSVLNYLMTRDTTFTNYTYQHFQNIIRKSTLISDVGEKERSRFFNAMREKIHNRKKAVNHYSV
ncbi:MAG TPA: hypothetical protein VMI35_02820 [Puia sp.]|nr:hypothetical protein [Puia sp.]